MSFVSALQPVQHDMKVGADDEQLDVLDEASNCAGLATDETPHWMLQPVQRDAEVVAEDEQAYLMKLQTVLAKQASAAGGPAGVTFRLVPHFLKSFCSMEVFCDPALFLCPCGFNSNGSIAVTYFWVCLHNFCLFTKKHSAVSVLTHNIECNL